MQSVVVARPPLRPAVVVLVVLTVLAGALLTLLPRAGASTADDGPVATGEPVADGVVRQTWSYGPAGDENAFDVYLPAGEPVTPRPTLLLVHGGSWEYGDKVEYADEAVAVARLGWTAISLNYRRTPTAPWPAPLQDVRLALRRLQELAVELGIDVRRTGALGDSAGGQLAALLGQPHGGTVPVRAVVTWSGVNDMHGLLRQPSSGGCVDSSCRYSGLARKVVRDLMRCAPGGCPTAYRSASPAATLGTGVDAGPATFAVGSERELIDPRQAWVMDAALARAGVPSRVRVLPGSTHGRGYQARVWQDSLSFLAAALTPETAPAFPRPDVEVGLATAHGTGHTAGRPVRLSGAVRPRAVGSSVALQVRGGDGAWRTARTVPLRAAGGDTVFDLSWTPSAPGRTTWRAVWRGGGGLGTSEPLTVVAR